METTCQISISDWINIAQTIIMFLTGVIVVWYTIETAKIRKETSNQNAMLAEQIKIMELGRQHELDKEQQERLKEISLIKPFFRFGGGSSNSNEASWEFTNKGGSANKIRVKSIGAFNINISPTRFLDTNEKGRVHISATELIQGKKYSFEIICSDKLGNEHILKYFIQHQNGVFEEESS